MYNGIRSIVPGVLRGGLAALFLLMCPVSKAAPGLLHASGRAIVNPSGATVCLNGVNLGSWLVMENWMCPMDSGSLTDMYSVILTLDNRFGVAAEQNLIRIYQSNWITTDDLDNIKNGGYNCVRVPVWWGDFYSITNVSNSGWRPDAFAQLDWLVGNCSSRGIYVIIDMHGVVGGQSDSAATGQAGQNDYWTDGNAQGNTAWMWWQIASHYSTNAAVAGYDLINEPVGAPGASAVWGVYSNLYNTIRSADTNHMIIMEGTFGNWDWDMLPNPASYGWTNVVYSMHEYQNGGDTLQVEEGASNQVTDFQAHASWNVPDYIGEYNDYDNGTECWDYSAEAYNNAGISWTMWAYKAANGLVPNDWGWYDPTNLPGAPNITTDSSNTIASDWGQWKTTAAFVQNPTVSFQRGCMKRKAR